MPWRAPRHRRTAELSAYRRAAQGILDGATDRREARAIDSASAYISGMKRYRLDPKNPRQLTDEEARRLDEAAIDYSDIPPLFDQIDWSQCPDVESVPGRCSGAWVVKDSRVIVESCILDNADAGASPEEIAEWFEVPGGVDVVRRILAFAGQ